MSDWSYSDISSLSTPGGTVAFNASAADTIILDPLACSGLGVSQVRTATFKRGQASGYFYAAAFLEDGQHLVLTGVVRILSASTEAAVVSARDAILTSLRTSLKSILGAEGTLNIGGDTLAVRCEQLPEASGGFLKTVTFGLVSTTPA